MIVTPQIEVTHVYADNLLPQQYTFDVFGVSISTVGTGTSQIVATNPFSGDKCVKLTNTDVENTDFVANLSGTQGDYEVQQDGRYLLTWAVKNPSYNVSANNGEVRLFKNGSPEETYEFSTDTIFDNWIRYWGEVDLQSGDVINIRFVFATKGASVVANEYIFFDGFALYYDDRLLATPPVYTPPLNYKADGSIINNSTDTIALTGSTDNLIQIQPDSDQYMNGNLPLLDANGKVTPISTGDTLTIDYRFTTVAPTTDGAIVYAKFKVSTFVQKQERFVLSSTNGEEEVWRFSFSITVTDSAFGDVFDFLGDGGLFYLNPSENINVKNCRVEVARTVRGL